MTSKNGRYPLRILRILAVVICLTFAAGLVGALTVPAHADPVAAASHGTHAPGIPGPGGVLDFDFVPTLHATPTGTGNPFRIVQHGTAPSTCAVGTVAVPCFPSEVTNSTPDAHLPQVVKYAGQTNIDPRLILTILYGESAHCHAFGCDAADGVYDWATHKTEGPSYGMADMKQGVFLEVQAAHPTLFGKYQWSDLQTNDDLAIDTLAWKLYDITVPSGQETKVLPGDDRLPRTWNKNFKRDEMIGMAWNKGAGAAIDYAKGVLPDGNVKRDLTNYKAMIDQNWDRADQVICRSGAFTCSL